MVLGQRVWLETFRAQNWIILGVPTATWLGVITFIAAGGFLWLRHRRGWGVPGAWIKEKRRWRRLPPPPRPPSPPSRANPARSQALAERSILPDVTAAIGGTRWWRSTAWPMEWRRASSASWST